MTFSKSVTEIRRAVLREFRAGTDVGELLALAISSAQEALDVEDDGFQLTANRPGSWEAAPLQYYLDSTERWRTDKATQPLTAEPRKDTDR